MTEVLKTLDAKVAHMASDLEQMAPNLKAMDRLDDVEAKLIETEREADKARDQSNDIQRQQCVFSSRRCSDLVLT